MNIEAYIASGVLEAYVLGELTVREQEQVVLQVQRYPALHDELVRIEKTMEQLVRQASVKPKPHLKDNVLQSAGARIKVQPVKASNFWVWLAAASVMLACFFAYLAYNYHARWSSTSQQLAEIELRNQQIAQNLNTVNLELSKIQSDINIVDNPAFSRVLLTGTNQAPDSKATVFWNASTHEVYLRIQHLQVLATENQFQLWALIDGKPVDMGVFDVTADLMKMKTTARADAFAVTIEARGGSSVPSLHTLQVIGNIKG
ncbi:MAG: anti-sigma factor [Cyclobacteriaceae bacterium]|nr:anti-sigma factor [Cyclobacteriaceae bacterium]